jgi:hypothetical protein
MIPEVSRLPVDILTLQEIAGFFIWYFRCPLDILSQILNYKTQDCGKQCVLFLSWAILFTINH